MQMNWNCFLAEIFLPSKGGEIVFCDGDYIPEQTKASGVVFPSNFIFSHEVKKVIKGNRYSLMTWIL